VKFDFIIVRESTEGLVLYRLLKHPQTPTEVTDTMRITTPQRLSERLFRSAFEQAIERRQHLTLVDKANVLPSMAFFRRVFDEAARRFPSVQTDRIYVDAASLYLVQRPETFDVLVTENMFGDVSPISAAGALIGGMGMGSFCRHRRQICCLPTVSWSARISPGRECEPRCNDLSVP